jgi:two-component sensor histidine kinase/CHASE1-domain containing sensor protein
MDKALLARVEQQAWFHRHPRGLPLLLFALTLAATILGVFAIERSNRDTRQLELETEATKIASALQRMVSENEAYLTAAGAVFSTRDIGSPGAFASFVDNLNSGHAARGALGMGWGKLLAPSALPAFEAKMRARGIAGYRVYPRPTSTTRRLMPVVYMEPGGPAGRTVVGFDMYSEVARRTAIDKALATGRATVSGKVFLARGGEGAAAVGFLIYAPVADEAGGGVKGVVFSPVRATEFLREAIRQEGVRGVNVAVYDGSRRPATLLTQYRQVGRSGVTLDRPISIGGRQWVLSLADKKPISLTPLSRATLLFGMVLALLLMALAMLITRRAAEARVVLEWLSRESAIRTSLTRELNHRVKNTLANVISIIALTRRRSDDMDEFIDSLTGRIRALSATHDLLSKSEWSNARIEEIIRSELAPYMDASDNHVQIEGEDISLAPNDAMSLGLAIHELATNAAKYGAFSTPTGKVHVSWRLVTPELAEVEWRESGGPPVTPPTKRGFGMDLIGKILANELRTNVDLRFDPEGLSCRLRLPVRRPFDFSLRNLASPGQAPARSVDRAA